ncbi:hypothetical protein [Candidatus Thiosymbion oneisti]|uniref:hypothetical protein n=1 Tax=Candidatus Thiosymbion oneisti TaxID=589554 RepID=UPI001061842D|nr:hypothetical protein [Candidatus Thiosymbion oneisti]
MSIFKNPSTRLSRLWARLGENGPWTWIFSGVGVAVLSVLFNQFVIEQHPPGPAPNPEPAIRTSGSCSPVITNRLGGVDAVIVCSELSDQAEAALIRALESKSVTLEDAQKEVDKWISRYERLVDELAEINQGLDGDDPLLEQVEELVRDGQLDLAERLFDSALTSEKAAVARFAAHRYARAGVRTLDFDREGALEDHQAAYH